MANITTQTIRVDLNTGREIPTAFVHQNDTSRTLVFDVFLNGSAYDISNYSARFAYVSPTVNGQHTVIAGTGMASGTVSGNRVTFTLPQSYTQISGVGLLTMVITPSSGTIRPVNIRLVVQKSADGDNEIASASDFPTTLEEYTDEWLVSHMGVTLEQVQSLINNSATLTMIVGGKTYVYNGKDSLAVRFGTNATSSMKDADGTSY